MMPCGWERRHEDVARVLGLICSSADAAGPGFEPKGASASRLASQTVAPRPETSGNTPTAALLLDLEDGGHVEPKVPEGEDLLASRPQRGRSVCPMGSTNTGQLEPLWFVTKS